MKPNSLFLRLFLVCVFLVLILTGLTLLFSVISIQKHYISVQADGLERMGEFLVSLLPEKDPENLISSVAQKSGVRITLIRKDGTVVADSEKNPSKMDNHAHRPEVLLAVNTGSGRAVRFSDTLNISMLYVALLRTMDKDDPQILRISLPLSDVQVLIRQIMQRIFISTGILSLLVILISWIISKRLSRPVQDLAYAAQKVAEGDFNAYVFYSGKGQTAQLVENFNVLVSNLKTRFDDMQKINEELRVLIDSLEEGILVCNFEGAVRLMNKSFTGVCPVPPSSGSYYWDLIDDPGFSQQFEKIRNQKGKEKIEIRINNRIFLVKSVSVVLTKEIISVFHDITEVSRLEQVKRDFVQNVSHELRTPLTAVKGFVETLGDETDETKRLHYQNIILRHANRLISIVNDLRILSNLEQKNILPVLRTMDLRDVLNDVYVLFTQQAKKRGLDFKCTLPSEALKLTGDPDKLHEVFINLIDNAFKYTESGAINLIAEQIDGMIRVKIRDTGIGIPQEYQDRIFERFFVVDQSRSRERGGTGLGLSIVKHIVLLHSGKIYVQSEPGNGTEIILEFPVQQASGKV